MRVLPAFRTLRAAPIRRRRYRRIGVCLPPFSIAAARRRKRYFVPQRFSSPCSTVSVRLYTAPLQTAVTAGTAVSEVYNRNIFSTVYQRFGSQRRPILRAFRYLTEMPVNRKWTYRHCAFSKSAAPRPFLKNAAQFKTAYLSS